MMFLMGVVVDFRQQFSCRISFCTCQFSVIYFLMKLYEGYQNITLSPEQKLNGLFYSREYLEDVMLPV
jgi:hypothetical protein